MTRDQFLAKKMGINFKQIWSKEKWFFIVWNWAKEQEWFKYDFMAKVIDAEWLVDDKNEMWVEHFMKYINPDRFADAIAKFLGWEVSHD